MTKLFYHKVNVYSIHKITCGLLLLTYFSNRELARKQEIKDKESVTPAVDPADERIMERLEKLKKSCDRKGYENIKSILYKVKT